MSNTKYTFYNFYKNCLKICKVLLTKLDHFQTSLSLSCSPRSGPTQTGGGGGGWFEPPVNTLRSPPSPTYYNRGTLPVSVWQIFADKYQQICITSMFRKKRAAALGFKKISISASVRARSKTPSSSSSLLLSWSHVCWTSIIHRDTFSLL